MPSVPLCYSNLFSKHRAAVLVAVDCLPFFFALTRQEAVCVRAGVIAVAVFGLYGAATSKWDLSTKVGA